MLDVLSALKVKINKELERIANGELMLGIKHRGLLVSSEPNKIDLNEIDSLLINDIEDFLLFILNDFERDIILSRWGYNCQKQTLEDISRRYSMTRERVRQIESPINNRFTHYLRIHPKVIWYNIHEIDDLTKALPGLALCFESAKLFYSFLELCCQVEQNYFIQMAPNNIDQKILNYFFCNNASPVSYDVVIEEIILTFNYNKSLAKNILTELSNMGSIKIIEGRIYPANLEKKEAVAHALVEHPNGLPWKDIARIVNYGGYCATKLNEERALHHYLGDSKYVYLCDRGTYRHLKYLNLSSIDINSCMKHLLNYMQKRNINRLNLYDYYYQVKNEISNAASQES